MSILSTKRISQDLVGKCVDGFYATVNSISWIKHQEYIEKNELTELIKAVRKQDKNSSFKIEFVNDDGSEYK